MLTLFIVNSDSRNADRKKTIASFKDVTQGIETVWNLKDVNKIRKNNPWYGVIYDDEYIEGALAVSLNTFFNSDADVLVVFKKVMTDELHITKAPRFFRKHIILQEDSLLPKEPEDAKFETILNGWILSNDSNSI